MLFQIHTYTVSGGFILLCLDKLKTMYSYFLIYLFIAVKFLSYCFLRKRMYSSDKTGIEFGVPQAVERCSYS